MRLSTLFAIFIYLNAQQSAWAQVQQPAPLQRVHKLSLDANTVSTGGTSQILSSSSVTSTTAQNQFTGLSTPAQITNSEDHRHLSSGSNVEVKVRDFSGSKDTVTLEWYFFAYPVGVTVVQRGVKEMIVDSGSSVVAVPPNASGTWTVASKEMHNVTDNYTSVASGQFGENNVTFSDNNPVHSSQTKSGWTMKGWVVRLTDSGKVLAVKGSSDRYEQIAKDEKALAAFPRQ